MNYGIAKLISCFIPNKQKRHQFVAKYRNRTDVYGNKQIVSNEDAQKLIIEKINSPDPFLICRFGKNEFDTLYTFLNKKPYKKSLKEKMSNGAGFFPADDENLCVFSKKLLEILPDIDILAAWSSPEEAKVCNKYCSCNIQYIRLGSLCVPGLPHPWMPALQGKKVLVMHPFESSIKKQYEKRKLLFKNPNILPDFELLTMKPVQSMADNKSEYSYKTWFEALDDMKNQINKIDFDIALIGAGAYGIFLAHHCKMLGKKALHLGGATQILFGIIGKRWEEDYPDTARLINEHWVRPQEDEKPKGFEKIEGGCYW